MTPESTERRADWKAKLLERLHDPVQLRIGVMGVVFFLGYAAIYTPLSDQIEMITRRLNNDRKMLNLAISMETLQKQYRTFVDRVPQQADNNEWMQYVIDGTRQFPQLSLLTFGFGEPKAIPPYKAVILKLELRGTFLDLNKFLMWLESNQRLLRADDVRFNPPRGVITDVMNMQITVIGMTS